MWKPVDFTPTPIEKYLASHRKKSLGLPDQVFDEIAAKMISKAEFKEFLKGKLNAGFPINYKRSGKETLLHHALKMYVQPEIVYTLLILGSDVNITNYRGQNALHLAANYIWWNRDMGVYSAIIKDIKDLDVKDKYGSSVIDHLVYEYIYSNNSECSTDILNLIHMILRAGADPKKNKNCLNRRCYKPAQLKRKQELLNFFSQYEVLHDASTENFFEYAL